MSRVSFQVEDAVVNEAAQASPLKPHKKGDEPSMKKIIDTLYDKVLHDSTLSPFFEDIDIGRLKLHQCKLMTLVFGGKDLLMMEDASFDLRKIHLRSLIEDGLSMQEWGVFVAHFESTLDELENIPATSKASAVTWLRGTRNDFRPAEPQEVEAFNSAKAAAAAAAPSGCSGGCPFSGSGK